MKVYIVDVKDKVLGRVSSEIANLLRGRNDPDFAPYLECGNKVIVIN